MDRLLHLNKLLLRCGFFCHNRVDGHKAASLSAIDEFDLAGDLGKERVVAAAAHIEAGLHGCAPCQKRYPSQFLVASIPIIKVGALVLGIIHHGGDRILALDVDGNRARCAARQTPSARPTSR